MKCEELSHARVVLFTKKEYNFAVHVYKDSKSRESRCLMND